MSWPMVPLGELMADKTPSVDPAKHSGEEFELWSIPAFDAGAPEAALGSEIGSAKKLVRPSDVLLSRIVPHIRRSWVVAAPSSGRRQIASGEWIVFRSGRIYPPYLRQVLLGDTFHAAFMGTVAGVGGSLLRARPEAVKRIEIALPSLPEQRRIAATLDQADALRRLRRRSLLHLANLELAMFNQSFLNKDASGWPQVMVEDLVDQTKGGIRTGPFGSQLLHSEFVESGVAVLGIDNAVANEFRWAKERHITQEKYATLRRYKVNPGDVLITIMGTCGRCAIVPDDVGEAINTKHLCCISLDRARCDPDFLHSYFLHHPVARDYLKARSKGAIMDGLNMGIIKRLPVLLPPLENQVQFKNTLLTLRQSTRVNRSAADNMDFLFASLQHRAFRGEL